MAFLKTASANLIKPDISKQAWHSLRTASIGKSQFVARSASSIPLGEYNPDDYMLSHCTIVASVDTEDGPRSGSPLSGLNQKYLDYYVTPATEKYINSNYDCWERKLLLSAAPSFIGGENYVEHVQIPELSKGKIIDMAARDVGDSIYIDILVATHKKYTDLIDSIKSRRLNTLSMGCSIKFSICTKCGNVAADSTELCTHIKYEKGSNFTDAKGVQRRVAELCGHIDCEPGSVEFIEASWVNTPAFPGAVVRNILSPEVTSEYKAANVGKLHTIFSNPSKQADSNLMSKAAFDFGQQQDAEEPQEAKKDPMDSAVEDLSNFIRDKALNRLKNQLKTPETKVPYNLDENQNNTIIKEASDRGPAYSAALNLARTVDSAEQLISSLTLYRLGGWPSVIASKRLSGRRILAVSRLLDLLEGRPGFAGISKVYATVLSLGKMSSYKTTAEYLNACESSYGRALTASERNLLLEKGRIFSDSI
jgi:hypothetical protein